MFENFLNVYFRLYFVIFCFSDTELVLQGLDEYCTAVSDEIRESEGTDTVEAQWNNYWEQQGAHLVWQSWLDKYKDFIDPCYLTKEVNPSEIEAAVEDLTDIDSDDPWAHCWENHKKDIFNYYRNWFFQWYMGPKANTFGESVPLDVDGTCNMSNLSIHPTLEEAKPVPVNLQLVKEQKDKTVLEKTEEFLVKLGFSSSVSQGTSNAAGCSLKKVNKKRKKKRGKDNINFGREPSYSCGSSSVPKVRLLFGKMKLGCKCENNTFLFV